MSTHVVQRMTDTGRALVFGMRWQVLIGESLDRLALKEARRARVTHYLRGGSRSHAVGLVSLSRADQSGLTLYSAAAALAAAYPSGAVVARVKLPEGTWIGAVLNGVVLVDGDTVYADAAAANAAVQHLRGTHPGLMVLGDDGDEPLAPHAITGQLNPSTELRAATFTWHSLPSPIKIGIGLALVTLIGQQAFSAWNDHQREQQRAARSAATLNATDAWREATRNWAAGMAVDGKAGLHLLYTSLRDVPLEIARWQLRDMDCQAAAAAWQCEAKYVRGYLGTNDGLVAAKPDNWAITWDGVDAALVRWSLQRPATALDLDKLPESAAIAQLTVSRWQELRAALSDLKVSSPTLVSITVPTGTGTGTGTGTVPFPSTGGPMRPVQLAWQVTAPLRSLTLAPLGETSKLEKITVRYQPDATPSLARSALMATLSGTTYAY